MSFLFGFEKNHVDFIQTNGRHVHAVQSKTAITMDGKYATSRQIKTQPWQDVYDESHSSNNTDRLDDQGKVRKRSHASCSLDLYAERSDTLWSTDACAESGTELLECGYNAA